MTFLVCFEASPRAVIKTGSNSTSSAPARVLGVRQAPRTARTQVGCLVDPSPIIARRTIFREGDEAHSDWISAPRAIDGDDLVVGDLMTAVYKFDRASRTRSVVQSRSDPLYSRHRALTDPCRRTLRHRGRVKSEPHCRNEEEAHHICSSQQARPGLLPTQPLGFNRQDPAQLGNLLLFVFAAVR